LEGYAILTTTNSCLALPLSFSLSPSLSRTTTIGTAINRQKHSLKIAHPAGHSALLSGDYAFFFVFLVPCTNGILTLIENKLRRKIPGKFGQEIVGKVWFI